MRSSSEVAVLLYPGCVFFEVALAVETLAEHFSIRYYTPDGEPHASSNGALVQAAGDFQALGDIHAAAILVPGGDPGRILVPENLVAAPLVAQAGRGALLAGICAGNLVLAAAGVVKGRRGTHNYTAEHAPSEAVAATAKYWQGMHFERANIVKDGGIITAQPWAYRQYAAAVAHHLGVLSQEEAASLEAYVTHSTYRSA